MNITLTGFRTEYGWARGTEHCVATAASGIADDYARLAQGGSINTFRFQKVGDFEGVPVVMFEGAANIAFKDFSVPVTLIAGRWERDRSRCIKNEFGGYSRSIHLPALGNSFALSDEEFE